VFLDLRRNLLTEIPEDIKYLEKIEKINFRKNRISSINTKVSLFS
jgi:Leucine-rich repeat (LRR) protein